MTIVFLFTNFLNVLKNGAPHHLDLKKIKTEIDKDVCQILRPIIKII
jgi:hypothetical protein